MRVFVNLQARSHNREEHLLAFFMSVRPSPCIRAAPTGRFSMKFGTGDIYVNLWRNSRFG